MGKRKRSGNWKQKRNRREKIEEEDEEEEEEEEEEDEEEGWKTKERKDGKRRGIRRTTK